MMREAAGACAKGEGPRLNMNRRRNADPVRQAVQVFTFSGKTYCE
jgi:hypothetical protein